MDYKHHKQNTDLLAVKRFILRLLLIAALCNVIACAQDLHSWGEELMGRQLGLQVTVSESDSIIAHVLLRNTTDAPIHFEGTRQRRDFEWVVSSDGREVPLRVPKDRREAALMRMDDIGSIRGIGIEPHASIEYSVDLRKFYDFLPNSEYVITAVFQFSGVNSTAWFRISGQSNDINEVKSGSASIRTSASAATNTNSAAALSLRSGPETITGANQNTEAIPVVSVPGKIKGIAPVSAENTLVSKVQTTAADSSIGFTTTQKSVLALSVALLVLVLTILWRAARRKQAG
jgi:hypothetical protein